MVACKARSIPTIRAHHPYPSEEHDPYPRSVPVIHTLVWESSAYLAANVAVVLGSGAVGGGDVGGDGAETFVYANLECLTRP